jgi:hypothetical protein
LVSLFLVVNRLQRGFALDVGPERRPFQLKPRGAFHRIPGQFEDAGFDKGGAHGLHKTSIQAAAGVNVGSIEDPGFETLLIPGIAAGRDVMDKEQVGGHLFLAQGLYQVEMQDPKRITGSIFRFTHNAFLKIKEPVAAGKAFNGVMRPKTGGLLARNSYVFNERFIESAPGINPELLFGGFEFLPFLYNSRIANLIVPSQASS